MEHGESPWPVAAQRPLRPIKHPYQPLLSEPPFRSRVRRLACEVSPHSRFWHPSSSFPPRSRGQRPPSGSPPCLMFVPRDVRSHAMTSLWLPCLVPRVYCIVTGPAFEQNCSHCHAQQYIHGWPGTFLFTWQQSSDKDAMPAELWIHLSSCTTAINKWSGHGAHHLNQRENHGKAA
jgi:hypothetical protein